MVRYTDLQSMVGDEIISGLESRPNCVKLMQQEFVEYITGEKLTHAYPVLEIFANPRGGMQGGFISAAFDNTIGSLVCMVVKHMEFTTIDLNVSYHKPIYVNDKLTTTAYIKSQGKTIIHLTGEAYDKQKNLIATATSKYFIFKKG